MHVRGNISVEDLVWYKARGLDFGVECRRYGESLPDFMVLGSRKEKSSNLVQVRP